MTDTLKMTSLIATAVLTTTAWPPDCVSAAEPVAIFHVGNSLTDQAYGMHDMAVARGHQTKFGRHMIPGAPLDWLWDHRAEGFREPGQKPADEVMYRLHQKMQQGEVAGYKHIADLYEDGVHLKAEGKYREAVTHYATVFQDNPHDCITSGLRFWKAPYSVDKEFAAVVWDVAWEVVTTYKHTGVERSHPESD